MSFRRLQAADRLYTQGWLTCALVALTLLAVSATPVQAQSALTRVGPVGFGGYPAWYQDRTGLAMDFCSPTNQSELDGGWCLLLPPGVFAPETFPAQFFDEHFYWAGNADGGALSNGGKALLTLALEGAFAVGPVVPGDQIVFARTRIVLNPLPSTGTYTVYTPYGKYVFANQTAGSKLFFTEDLGIGAPGDFNLVLQQAKTAPFLLPSASPGGLELPPISAAGQGATAYPDTGKKYIADPARSGPATGSPLDPFVSAVDGQTYDHNVFRVEFLAPGAQAPVVLVHTNNFTLMGRVFEGPIGGRVTVDRASFARSATATKVDVFATGIPGVQARIPAQTLSGAILPALQYYDAPCVANLDGAGNFLSWSVPSTAASHQMFGAGTTYWGQSAPAIVPPEVCVVQTNARDGGGNTITTFFPAVVGDQVTVTEALYDPANQRLSVQAQSSDQLVAQTLTVSGFGAMDATGRLVVAPLLAPPATLRVTSTGLGAADAIVSTGIGSSGSGTTVPLAANDTLTVLEDSGATTINVLANDSVGAGPIPAGSIVVLASQPQRGTAILNVDNTITYTPNVNASGTDAFTYTVAVNGVVSNVANVGITVTPVNDAPVAVNDSFFAAANQSVALPLLANDLDVDGNLAVGGTVIATAPAGVTSFSIGANGVLTFQAPQGVYTFTYRAQDAAGAQSANSATVTVNVGGTDTVTIAIAEYRRNQGRLRISGTVSPVNNPAQRIEIRWANGSDTVSVVTAVVADAAGNWAVDIRGATGIQNPDSSGASLVRASSPGGGTRTVGISFR